MDTAGEIGRGGLEGLHVPDVDILGFAFGRSAQEQRVVD
jgi:hypothetical protein